MPLPSAGRAAPSLRLSLRLPLLALLGAMTMGSGFGNPGCGSSSDEDYTPSPDPICDDTCNAIEGTYRLSFTNNGPLGGDCDRLGMKLPTEFVFSRDGETLKGRVSDVAITGDFRPGSQPYIWLGGEDPSKLLADGNTHLLRVSVSGRFSTTPASAKEPSTFKGTYRAFRRPQEGQSASGPTCDIDRDFTATRLNP